MEPTARTATFLNAAKLKMLCGDWNTASEYAEQHMKLFTPLRSALKAAVGATTFSDLGPEYFDASAAFVNSLIPKSAFLTIGQSGIAAPLRQPIFAATLKPLATTVGGFAARPASKVELGNIGLAPVEAQSMIVATRETLTNPAGKDFLERELQGAVTGAMDQYFLASLIDTLGSDIEIGASTGVSADLKTMLDVITPTGAENPVLVVDPPTANSLATTTTTPDGLPIFPDMSPNGGMIHGIRVFVTGNMPEGDSVGRFAVMVDAASMVYGIEGLELGRVSDAGVIDMSDDPDNTNMVSMFQADAVAMLVTARFAWKFARDNAFTAMIVDW